MRKRFALAGAAILATIVLPVAAETGAAASTSPVRCTTVVHTDLKNVKTDNDKDGTATDATTVLLPHGVKVTTPDDASKMYARFSTSFALSDVTKMSYKTFKYTSADTLVVPAYEIEVFLSGHTGVTTGVNADPVPVGWVDPNYTTLVYEPYQAEGNAAIQENVWQSWNAYQGGAAKWWSTHPLTGIPGDKGQSTPEPWSAILAAYPHAIGFDYDLNQGTNNTGAVTAFDDLTFGTKTGCTTNLWTSFVRKSPSPSPSKSRGHGGNPHPSPSHSSSSAVPVPSTSSSTPVPTATSTPIATGGGSNSGGSLPLTGAQIAWPAGIGASMLLAGVGLFWFARRKRRAY